jgi:preprotein translocase subunit YajC
MFISPAYAQSGAPGADMSFMFVMLAFLAIFYFLVLRPQQSRANQHRDMINKVRRGDTVVTAGGFVGKVARVQDNSDEIEVELSDTLKVRVVKSTLMDVRSKGEPVKDATTTPAR